MHQVHLTAFIFQSIRTPPAPVPARSELAYATAFKPPCKAGRRGGESTARQHADLIILLSTDITMTVSP
nr:hypothetical protein [Kosakonia sacchari]